jgi:two-component system sensor histidine kinase RegB
VETALSALLDNALFASRAAGAEEPIAVAVGRDEAGALVSVEDAGTGVPEGLRERLGEPFLTTKAPGEGMGLGLWLVRRAVEVGGGRLEVLPRAPCGTRVVLRLGEASA